MKTPKVQQDVTFFNVYSGFHLTGVFSAYQLREMFTDDELDHYWGYQVA